MESSKETQKSGNITPQTAGGRWSLENLENLFDIGHADALSTIKIPEDRAFLLAHMEKGQRRVMGLVY